MPKISLPGQLVRTRLFTLGVPDQFTITEGGRSVLFLRARAGDDPVTCLWMLDLESGTEQLLADPSASPIQGSGISAYATDAAGALAVFTVSGHLWAVDVARGGAPRRLPALHPATDPRPDPTGRRIAYVHAGSLRVIEADGSGDRELAAPSAPAVTFGGADFAARSSRGYWWSPAGDRILVKRVDDTDVQLWHIADPANPTKAPRTKRYPAAGTPHAEITVWLIGIDGTRVEVEYDHDAFAYVPDAEWTMAGPCISVASRDQRTARLLAINPSDGTTRVLIEQRDPCWVQPIPGLPTRTDDGTLLAHLDDGGTRYLTVDGAAVTPPGTQLRAVLGTDGGEILFTASTEPTEIELWSYRPGEGAHRLSTEPGIHTGVRRDGTLVHTTRRRDVPGTRAFAVRDGLEREITSFAERPVLELRSTSLALGPRELRAALYLPSWYEPDAGPLPVLMDPYGGSGTQRVTAQQDPHSLLSQWFAEQGFAVLVVDSSGTPGRGPEWEREVHGDLFTSAINDQVDALHAAARLHPELDLTRVGIRGWSFGGSLAVNAVLRRPDIFHAAVAGAGVTDQRLYNAPWRERLLGHPDEHPDRYAADSPLTRAADLSRPLLLIHGLEDDNVFPLHTLRLSTALLAAARPHEVLLLPGVGHAALSAPSTEPMLNRQLAFLKRHLAATGPGDTSSEK